MPQTVSRSPVSDPFCPFAQYESPMRTGLVLVSVLLFQAIGGGVAIHQAPEATPTTAPVPSDQSVTDVARTRAQDDALINQIAHLTLDQPSRQRLFTQSIDAAAAVSIGRDDAAARLDSYAFEERLRRTGKPGGMVAAEIDLIAAEVSALRDSERALWGQFVNGSVDRAEFVRESVHLQARATRLRARLSGVREALDRSGNDTLVTRVAALEHELLGLGGPHRQQALRGPVRERALTALRGTEGGVDLYAASSEQGFVFATINGSEYVREAYRADNHGPGNTLFGLTEAAELARTLYPAAFNLSVSLGYGISGLGRGAYLLDSELSFGSLNSYLDGTTRNIFFEIQRRDLGRLVQPASVTARGNGTRLIVNRSYGGGPLRVAVTETETGRPVETTVHVGETRHATGPDGVVWALTPPKAVFTVRAIHPSGNLTVSARPLASTQINGSS